MKFRIAVGILGLASLLPVYLQGQESPQPPTSDSVAKPKKKNDTTPPPPEEKQIPSEFKKPKDVPPQNGTTFRSNATTVNVEVSILDDKGVSFPKSRKKSSAF